MWKSKRFIAFCIGVILFILMIYTTNFSPLEIAGGITIITGIYIGAQTLRESPKE